MRHLNRRGKLGRKTEHRLMMLRNMATSLFDKERIQTTLPKAKQLRPYAEKLITQARSQDAATRRMARRIIQDRVVLTKLFDDIAKRFQDDKGGYTRIVRYKIRRGDGAELAFLELMKSPVLKKEEEDSKTKKKKSASAEEPEKEKAKKTESKGKDKAKEEKAKEPKTKEKKEKE
jgi:large subunit ribosomal protein L17